MTEATKLDDDGLERLADASASERVCVRIELEGGRPRTSLGLAAGLLIVALAGCATENHRAFGQPPELPSAALFNHENSDSSTLMEID